MTGQIPSLADVAADLKAPGADRQEIEHLIAVAARSKRLLHVLAWLLFEALADEDKSQLEGELRRSWAPTDADLARLLKVASANGLPCLLWLVDQSPRCARQMRRLWSLTEETGFRVPAEGRIPVRIAAAPFAALQAQQRRQFWRLLPALS